MKKLLFVLVASAIMSFSLPNKFGMNFASNDNTLKIALLKYSGGGDWYAVVDALQNMAEFCNRNLGTSFDKDYATVEVGSAEIFNYPFIFMTGHGNIVFSDQEAENLRNYLTAGGFLFVDDDYGMDPFFRAAMKKVFPEEQLVEIPFEHPIYHQKYDFNNGLPKVHEHEDQPSQGFGIVLDGRMVCFYGYESNISDGWESQPVHDNPENVRQESLKMGANIIQFAFEQ